MEDPRPDSLPEPTGPETPQPPLAGEPPPPPPGLVGFGRVEPTAVSRPPRRLGAAVALTLLAGFFGGQILGTVPFGLAIGVKIALEGGDPASGAEAMMERYPGLLAIATLVGFVAGAAVMVALALLLAGKRELRSREDTGGAWVLATPRQHGLGLLLGLAVGCVALAVPLVLIPPAEGVQPGPLAKMAATPGLAQAVVAVIAVLLAPPAEELLFRGVLLGGFIRSFGRIPALITVTLLFVLAHVYEAWSYPPALLGILALALATLWLRLRFGSVGPAVAAHLAYNTALIVPVLVVTGPGS